MTGSAMQMPPLQIVSRAGWRGDDGMPASEFVYRLSDAELDELEREGARLVAADPDLSTLDRDDYPLPVCAAGIAEWAEQLDHGLGFVLVRGLRVGEYSNELSSAIFFLLGLWLGNPMRQNRAGDVLTHIIATTSKPAYSAPNVLSSRTTSELSFHSDSADVVGLMCLHSAKEGGTSVLASGTTVYNEVVRRRPDLAARLFDTYHWDWRIQDPNSPTNTYQSPVCCYVDGVLSMYGGSKIVFTAQEYPEVPRLTEDQATVLQLVDDIAAEQGVALEMDFQPGDIQWLLNYTAMHSRTEYRDFPEPERRRHLIRLWLTRDAGRPMVSPFGKPVAARGGAAMQSQHLAALTQIPAFEA